MRNIVVSALLAASIALMGAAQHAHAATPDTYLPATSAAIAMLIPPSILMQMTINPAIVQVGKGVYYDPAIAAMDRTAALESWLPAALIGDNYNSSLDT